MLEKDQLRFVSEENLRAMEAFSRLLEIGKALFQKDEIVSFAQENAMGEEDAFHLLLYAALEIEDFQLLKRYLSPAVHKISPAEYRNDPYYAFIRFPEKSQGAWQLTNLVYEPYELFACGHPRLMKDGRVLPRLGYFTEPFPYPAVLENGWEWMTVTPNEISTMAEPLNAMHGNIAVFGLGLGYFAFIASQSERVKHVTIIERDKNVIALFQKWLLPQFPHKDKIHFVLSDAWDYAIGPMKRMVFDCAFVDLWHDVSDGLPFYLRFRKTIEPQMPDVCFHYWIEKEMLLFLRELMIDDWLNGAGRLDRLISTSHPLEDDFSLETIRLLVPQIKEAELR